MKCLRSKQTDHPRRAHRWPTVCLCPAQSHSVGTDDLQSYNSNTLSMIGVEWVQRRHTLGIRRWWYHNVTLVTNASHSQIQVFFPMYHNRMGISRQLLRVHTRTIQYLLTWRSRVLILVDVVTLMTWHSRECGCSTSEWVATYVSSYARTYVEIYVTSGIVNKTFIYLFVHSFISIFLCYGCT